MLLGWFPYILGKLCIKLIFFFTLVKHLNFFSNRVVIASDGVWDVANEKQISHFLRKSKNPKIVAKNICDFGKCQRLYGGLSPDDCSAVVVYLDTTFNI